jgi:hypothetical protein
MNVNELGRVRGVAIGETGGHGLLFFFPGAGAESVGGMAAELIGIEPTPEMIDKYDELVGNKARAKPTSLFTPQTRHVGVKVPKRALVQLEPRRVASPLWFGIPILRILFWRDLVTIIEVSHILDEFGFQSDTPHDGLVIFSLRRPLDWPESSVELSIALGSRPGYVVGYNYDSVQEAFLNLYRIAEQQGADAEFLDQIATQQEMFARRFNR